MALSLDDIGNLFATQGHRLYDGEPVTQLEHALQAAHRAETARAAPALVTAALLHDLGHLLNDQGETPTLRGVDDLHQYAALPFLRGLYDDDVLLPIKLQGGVFTADEAAAFIAQPHARDAVAVRLWDDLAKVPGAMTPPLAHFLPQLQAARRRRDA